MRCVIARGAPDVAAASGPSSFPSEAAAARSPPAPLSRALADLADRGVRAAAGLDRADARGRQRVVAREELGVLAREDVVRHDADRALVAQLEAELQHERRLRAARRRARHPPRVCVHYQPTRTPAHTTPQPSPVGDAQDGIDAQSERRSRLSKQ